jgi:anti-sigma regulatory factor (Ser/Thr protein kinase)
MKLKHAKSWYNRRARKIHEHELRRKRRRKAHAKTGSRSSQYSVSQRLNENIRKDQYSEIEAPIDFSIHRNAEKVLEFYESIEKQVQQGKPVFFRMENIHSFSADSIMYFLAFTRNLRKRGLSYSFRGDVPRDAKNRNLLEQTGFLSYVKSKRSDSITRSTEVVEIKEGSQTSGEVAKSFCDFVQAKLGYTLLKTRPLYEAIIELMSNTKHHAYADDNKEQIVKHWYIFARYEEDKERVRFVFLDTGFGIPATIQVRQGEQVRRMLAKLGLTSANDHFLIKSALDGEFRTRTRETHRGKGLPSVYKLSQKDYFQNFTVVSRKGFMAADMNRDMNKALNGSLFFWEMSKEERDNEKNH